MRRFQEFCWRELLIGVLLLLETAHAVPTYLAGNYVLRRWQVEDGLPQNNITSVLQTRDGFIWIGSYNGLARFDGAVFMVFDSYNAPQLRPGGVSCLFEDREGTLWIGHSSGGLTRHRLGHFDQPEWPVQSSVAGVTAMAQDEVGDLWILTANGKLARCRDGLVLSPQPGPARGLVQLAASPSGKIWVTLDGCMSELDHDGLKVIEPPAVPGFNYCLGICASDQGGFWVAGSGMLFHWKDAKWSGPFSLPTGGIPIQNWVQTKTGVLAAGTSDHGLMLWRLATNDVPSLLNRTNGLAGDWITTLTEDREGTLWIGTGGAGLFAARLRKAENISPPGGWQGHNILSVTTTHDGSLWVGTEGSGVYQFHNGDWHSFGAAEGLANPYVWSLGEDKNGRLWAGTWNRGVFEFTDGKFQRPAALEQIRSPVRALLATPTGGLWIGTGEGLFRFEDGATNSLNRDQSADLRSVTCLLETANGVLWCGTAGQGLFRCHIGQMRQFRGKDGLGSDFISCLHLDREGGLWVGTDGGGLARFESNTFVRVSKAQGLASDSICHLEEDERGAFWMSSHHGILRVSRTELVRCMKGDIEQVSCLVYGVNEGLPTIQCAGMLQPAGCRLPDGRLCFPTTLGVVALDPSAVTTNNLPPPVAIERLLVDDQTLAEGPVFPQLLTIAPGRHHLEFQFTGLSFVAPDKVRFKYRLSGPDRDWINGGNRRSAVYSFLPPGHYNFQLQACNNDGIWNETGAALAFIIEPHFWETPWFRVFIVMMVGLAAGAVMWFETRRRMRIKLDRLERRRVLESERARIARDIHDDLGAQLTHITMLSELASAEINNPGRATAFLKRIYDTGRELTRSMDEIVWAVNPRHDTLESLSNYLETYTNDFFGSVGRNCRVDFPMQFPQWMLSSELRHNVFLAYKEAVTNAVKHAQAGEIHVAMLLTETGFTLRVEDNGKGFCFDPGNRAPVLTGPPVRAGDGLHNMARRMREAGGSFDLQSAPGQGTRIVFQVPVVAINLQAQ